jgi:hypothetical protein
MARFIIKTNNPDGIPSTWELDAFRSKNGLSVNEVCKLYVAFKVNKRRKIKRLRIAVKSYPCELCGRHTYIDGKVGSKEFNKETF